MKKILTFAAIAALAFSCTREGTDTVKPAVPVTPVMVHITASADKIVPEADGENTKLSYEWSSDTFGWEDDDQLQIMLSKWQDDEHSAVWRKNVVIPAKAGTTGIFEGEVDFSNPDSEENPFTYQDIKGVVVVKAAKDDWFVGRCSISGAVNMCINIPGIQHQEQEAASEFSSGETFAFYSGITSDATVTYNDGDLGITGLKLCLGGSIWEYHLYADDGNGDVAGYGDEKILSISARVAEGSANLHNMQVTRIYWNETSNTGRRGYVAGSMTESDVTLGTAADLPTSRASAAVIWHNVAAGGDKTLSGITVKTDKATYYKSFNGTGKKITSSKNRIYPLYLNLANMTRIPDTTEYSTDGGNTWSTTFPTGTDVTTLAVRGNLVATDITALDTFIRAQSDNMSLDLSGCMYETYTFPKVFGNATTGNANKKLVGIKFPANVTTLATEALRYCTTLRDIDFSNIVVVGSSCFRGCSGIKTINLPVATTLNQYAFSAATNITSISIPKVVTLGTYALYNKPTGFKSLELPSSLTTIGAYALGGFSGVTSITIPSSVTSMAANSFNASKVLKTIYLNVKTPIATASILNAAGANATDKILYVPAGSVDAYKAHANWGNGTDAVNGYTITAMP